MLAAPDHFMREVDAWGTPPTTIDLMRRVKRAFDPDGILNPGRFVY
jgi:FAD/FMN-containing dehydrogenase